MDLHVDSANNMSLHTEDSQSDLSDYNEYSEYDNYSYYYGDYYGYDYDYTEDKVAAVINYVSILLTNFLTLNRKSPTRFVRTKSRGQCHCVLAKTVIPSSIQV